VGNSIHLLEPATLQETDVTSNVYWREPFQALASVTDLVEFLVLDIEPTGQVRGKHVLADAEVSLDNQIYHTRTHLGGILQPGDTVMGYHLARSNFNSSAFEALDPSRIPDVILVKKSYPNRKKKSKTTRNWKLKSIAKEAEDDAKVGYGRGALGRRGGVDQKKVEQDYELFLREIEEDPEMRQAINLYKGDSKMKATAASKQKGGQYAMDVDETPSESGEEGEAGPEVPLEELLDDFEEMSLGEDEE